MPMAPIPRRPPWPCPLWSSPPAAGAGFSGTTRRTITAEADRGGAISPSGRISVSRGSDQTLRITADDETADVQVDGDSVDAASRYTFENIRTKYTVEVVFEKDEATPSVADPDDSGVSG